MSAKTNTLTVSINLEELEAFVQRAVEAALAGKAAPAIEKEAVKEAPAKAAGKAPVKSKAAKAKDTPMALEDGEDEDEDEDGEDEEEAPVDRKSELEAMTVAELRKIAIAAGFEKADVKDADKETLVESIIDDEAGEEEDEEDGEEEGVSREDLEAMNLTALRKIAKTDHDMTAADYKGMDKDALIDAILGEGEEEEAEDDEDFEGYDEDELNDMSLAELKAIAKEWELSVKAGTKKPALVTLILEAQEEEDEDEDEDDE